MFVIRRRWRRASILTVVLVTGQLMGERPCEADPPTQEGPAVVRPDDDALDSSVEDELVARLLAIQRRPDAFPEPAERESMEALERWLREHRDVVLPIAKREAVAGVRAQMFGEPPPRHPIGTGLWLHAARGADRAAGIDLMVELFVEIDRYLLFVDALYRPGATVRPIDALGQEKYRLAHWAITIRNMLLSQLTHDESPAVIDAAKRLLYSDMSTAIHAARYLVVHVKTDPELREFLRRVHDDPQAPLHMSGLLRQPADPAEE